MKAVSNAGPLIHLHEIGRLELLSVFEAVFITPQVWAEVTAAGRVDEQGLRRLPNLQVESVEEAKVNALREQLASFDLHEGELSALCLCQQLNISPFLTDDGDARNAAKSLGLEPHGTVGVLVYAHRVNRLSLEEAKKALQDLLEKSTLFLLPAIVEQVIVLLEEHSERSETM